MWKSEDFLRSHHPDLELRNVRLFTIPVRTTVACKSWVEISFKGLGSVRDAKSRPQRNPTKLYPMHWTFINIMTTNTFAVCFVGRDNLAVRQSSNSIRGSASVH
jgi:hypothetical protein